MKDAKLHRTLLVIVIILVVLVGVGLSYFAKADNSPALYLTPTTQSVTNGSDVTITVMLNPSGDSINAVNSVLTYPAADYNFVSITTSSSFNTTTPAIESASAGTVQFAVANTGAAINSTVSVVNIVLQSTTVTTSAPLGLATVCGANDYLTNCSAAYDSSTNLNDLSTVAGVNYTVTPATSSTPPGGGTSPGTGTGGGGGSPGPGKANVNVGGNKQTNHSVASPSPTSLPSGSTVTTSSTPTATSENVSTYTIAIKVLNSSKKPVKGAVVSINGERATTNSEGVASLVAEAGIYKLSVTGKGIKPYNSTIDVQPVTNQQFETYVKSSSNFMPIIIWVVIVLAIIAIYLFIYKWIKRNVHSEPKMPSNYIKINAPNDSSVAAPVVVTSLDPPHKAPSPVVTNNQPKPTSAPVTPTAASEKPVVVNTPGPVEQPKETSVNEQKVHVG
jgi:flagellar basal body-associated protein FliL